MKQKLRIAIVGGGTGGHITPALAVAEELKKEHEVWFIGSTKGPEGDIIRRMDYPFHGIAAGKLRRYISMENVTDIFRIGLGFFQSLRLFMGNRPDALFAKGGYVTVPAVYAARLLRIPVVAHESDVIMGLANRLVFDRSTVVCTGFPETVYPRSLRSKLRFTGNPVRSIFRRSLSKAQTMRELDFSMRRPVVLVLGGSQGAQSVNMLLWDRLPEILELTQVIHLTGVNHSKKASSVKDHLTPKLQKRYQPFGFVGEELPAYMNAADIVISRSSANVMAELAALRKPMILMPLPSSASDHQRANAQVFRKKQAAVVLEEVGLTSDQFLQSIRQLITDTVKQRELSQATGHFDSPQAASLIAETIVATAYGRKY
jgi:UDP-N-acetylglucosamine--N-acetylmuramyl-(pentapeptide) pyrophosphoryl-undecaprenol N-acetylglucosamine transferase